MPPGSGPSWVIAEAFEFPSLKIVNPGGSEAKSREDIILVFGVRDNHFTVPRWARWGVHQSAFLTRKEIRADEQQMRPNQPRANRWKAEHPGTSVSPGITSTGELS
jgi:hypothetical protein